MIDVIRGQLEKHFPKTLVAKLLDHYSTLKKNFTSKHHESGELNGGKFAEVAFRMLQYAADPAHQYTPLGRSLPNIDKLIQTLESAPTVFNDSIRIHIPRSIRAIYDVRNRRGVGHTGEIDANLMDATFVMSVCDWVLAEMIRLYHDCSAAEAQAIVDKLVKHSIPVVYDRDGVKKVLRDTSYENQILLLLHYENESDVPISDLNRWVEHGHITRFTNSVLMPLHRDRKIHVDLKKRTARILPPGIHEVEEKILVD